MNTITATSAQYLNPLYAPGASNGSATARQPVSSQVADSAQLSPAALLQIFEAGQIAVNQQSGSISGDQAHQLYTQLGAIATQAASDRQADGGTISAADKTQIAQMAAQLTQQFQSDGGVTAGSTGQPLTLADTRQISQSGRVALDEQSGALSSAQGSALITQIDAVGAQNLALQQADGGTLSTSDARVLNQEQAMISKEIYHSANGTSTAGIGSPVHPSAQAA